MHVKIIILIIKKSYVDGNLTLTMIYKRGHRSFLLAAIRLYYCTQ